MKNKFYLFIVFFSLYLVSSCKKDSQPQEQKRVIQQSHSLEGGLKDFSISGELLAANIDTITNTITAIIPDSANQHKLTISLEVAAGVTATINNASIGNSSVADFTQPVVLTVSSSDKQRSTSFKITIEIESVYIGFDGPVLAAKSLNKNYNFYFDQMDGSSFQSVNCGPAAGAMAVKWADPAFTGSPADARAEILPQGEQWTLTDIKIYIQQKHIDAVSMPLGNIDSLVKTNIDNNQPVIFLINIWGIPYNPISYQHVSKFYQSGDDGHFILVKGYKQTATTFYLEVYDPFSNGERYTGLDYGQIKGQDRYYIDKDVYHAAEEIEPNFLVVAPKGKKIMASIK